MATKQRTQIPKGKHGGMQLVLTEDVASLGKQGDVVEVRQGYGRNYLIPRGMATIPTQHNLRLLDRYKIRVKQALEARLADLRALAAQITNRTEFVTIEANAHRVEEEGKEKYLLYGSVGQHEISKALRGKGLPIDPDMVVIEGGGVIKEAGLFAVKLNLGHGIESEAKVAVIPSKT